jgi:hypothetical protein
VNVIWHHNSDTQIEFYGVVVQAAIEHNVPYGLRQNPALVRAECYKVLMVVALKMRKPSTIKSLPHKLLCRDSRPRLSAERSSVAF